MENRHGLIVDALVSAATGTAEREAALAMLGELPQGGRITIGGDKNYDTRDFVQQTRHPGYAISQRKRQLVEQAFGWMKTVGLLRKLHHRGGPLVAWIFTFHAAAYNLVRLRRLLAQPV